MEFEGSRYSVNLLPAASVQDILINSLESLLQLRDVVLARAEEEVCHEIVIRIPVSERLRLEIARQALERDSDSSPERFQRAIAHAAIKTQRLAAIDSPAPKLRISPLQSAR